MKEAPVASKEDTSTYESQVSEIEKLNSAMSTGLAVAGPAYAAEPETLPRSALETAKASLSQGLTASIFGGFSIDKEAQVDPNFDVSSIMRPGDERYALQYYNMPNEEIAREFQQYTDEKEQSQKIMAARPWLSFGAQLLDPTQLGLDLTTYGLGKLITLPLIGLAAQRVHTATTAAQLLKKYPRSANAIIEATIGAESGAASMYGQTKIKALTDYSETEENIGQNVFFGAVVGAALGGAVGLIGKHNVNQLSGKFSESNRVAADAAGIPNDFVGPPKPPEEGILSTGKRVELRAQEEKRKLTPEEIKQEAENLKLKVDAERPIRKEGYAKLRDDFMQLKENAMENTHPLIRKAFSLVTWPIRNLSAANRLLNSPFGTGRMYTIGMVRNPTELVGTRNGMVIPRSAQNRIEDINNQYVSTLLDINEMFLEANQIKKGAFAGERQLLSEKLYDQDAFYEDIGTQVLHVNKATEFTNNTNPIIQKAARHAYEKLYRPFGELLKEYGLIKDAENMNEVLNYLNRHWMSDKILADPEGFLQWLSNLYDEQNQQLKSLMPAYEQELKNAKQLAKDAERFEKAADILDKLEKKLSVKDSSKIKKETAIKYEYLKKKYSRQGLEAYYRRKLAEKMGGKFAKNARKIEEQAIQEAPAINEARIIAEELREGAQISRERAEAIIPWELRSNKTGKPRRTYDPETEPGYSYNMAERTMYTMLGQEDQVIINPVLGYLGGGKPGMFKPRDIKVLDNYPGIENWVQRDIRFLMHNFATGIAPPIALHELMLQLNEMPLIRQIVKKMQIENPNIGPKKALNLPDTMQDYNEIQGVMQAAMLEEFKFMSEGLTGKPLQELLDKLEAAQAEMTQIDAIIRGVNGNGLNVNSKKMADFMDLFNSAVSTVTTTNIVISMLTELMSPAIRYGFEKYIKKSILPRLASPELRAMSKKEAKGFNMALNVAKGALYKSKITGNPNSMKNSALGRFFSNLSNRLQSITGANKLLDTQETASMVLIKANLLDMAEKVAFGTITDKELTHMAQRSLGPKAAKNIYKLWKKYGEEIEGVKGIDPEKLADMSPSEAKAFHDYSAFINDELKTIIVKPGAGSMPDISYTPWGKAIMYLKKYFFAYTNDTLVPGIQRADAEAAQGFMGLFFMGALQSELRRIYRGEERKEFDLNTFVVDALSNSAVGGLYTYVMDIGVTAGLISGTGAGRYDPTGGLSSLILGPGIIGKSGQSVAILGKLNKIYTDEDRQFTYKEFNQIGNAYMPLYKWYPIAALLKPNIKEYFEEQGRGGD